MNALALHVAMLATAQVQEVADLVKVLKDGGPWAIMALTILGLVWIARMYVKARDDRDSAISAINDKLTGILVDVTKGAEKQAATNDKIIDLLDRIERRIDVPAKP